MGATSANGVVDEYFARQYGVITSQQARRAGLTPRMVQNRIETGRWRPLGRGMYAVTSAPRNWRQALAAAVLAYSSAIVAGRSAARLHGFAGVRSSRPEILVPPGANARSKLARVERSVFFQTVDTARVDGFVVLSPAETVLSLAHRFPARLETMVDATLVGGTATLEDYDVILDRIDGGRVKGSRTLRRIIEERRPEARQLPTSELERLSRRLTDHPDVPPVTHQHPVLGSAGRMIVDTFIDDWGLVLEVDGRNYHTRKADFERDRRRDNAAVALGYVVVRFTWQMVVNEFDYCLETLLATGRQRAPR